MKVTLVVESNEQLRSIYALNLKIWVASETLTVKSASQARSLIESQDDISLIITKVQCGEENTAQELLNILKSKNKEIPMIVLGKSELPISENFIQLDTGLEFKPLIQQSARFLGVTAKDMAALQVPDYFEVPLEFFRYLKRSVVDVYFREGREYHLKFEANADFSQDIIKNLSANTANLYVTKNDRLRFVANITSELVTLIPNQEMNADDAMKVQQMGMSLLQEKINLLGITPETVELSKRNIKQMVGNSKKYPKLGNLVARMLKNKASYLFKHTQILSHVCLHIMEHIDWGNEDQKQKIAFVCFFHDIVLETDEQAMIHSEKELKAATISAPAKELVRKHAQLSAEMVHKFPSAPMGADIIIRQHHGVTHGIGFSESYGGNLSPMTIVLILAEDFTDGILRSAAVDSALNVPAKIAQMREKYPTQRFQKIIDLIESITF